MLKVVFAATFGFSYVEYGAVYVRKPSPIGLWPSVHSRTGVVEKVIRTELQHEEHDERQHNQPLCGFHGRRVALTVTDRDYQSNLEATWWR